MNKLTQPVTVLKGIGKQKAAELHQLSIDTVEDLLTHYPYRYEDRANLKPISQLSSDQLETVLGRVEAINEGFTKSGRHMLRVTLANNSGRIVLMWFNQRYLKQRFALNQRLIASGKILSGTTKQMMVTDFEILSETDDISQFARLVPVHRASEKLSAKWIRQTIEQALRAYGGDIIDFLPQPLCQRYRLLPRSEAIAEIHFPSSWAKLNMARYRLVIEEFTLMLLELSQRVTPNKSVKGIAHQPTERLTNQFIRQLPFKLTNAQRKVILEIKSDMEKPTAMHRLVQGDVGSGKTMVALYTLLKAAEGGYQSALMAPTEILAEQHYLTLRQILAPLGIEPILLKGSLNTKEKTSALEKLANGDSQIIIGTHALIQKNVNFCNLGAIVIDEQHRFGVRDRLALENKGSQPDVLVMTATPIPRSLALTLYGDLELSVIDELPPGRKPIITYHITEKKRQSMYGFILQQLQAGHQVYVVCPMIEESAKIDLENAQALHQKLATEIFPQYQVGLLHGKMTATAKAEIMESFRTAHLQILVSTTVIEVGVDVPNANMMVIENAERFGLAQLHQLRGRVGRGDVQSYCILVSEAKAEDTQRRMAIMTKSNDGFAIAEEDLAIRGPGEILGIRQSGLPDFKIADLVQDIKLLERSKLLAADILNDGLENTTYDALRLEIQRRYQQKIISGIN